MRIEIDGEPFDLDDDMVREDVEQLDAEDSGEPEGSRYVFGIHVTHTRELREMGDDIAAFMQTVGEGTFDVQVSVNAKLDAPEEKKDFVVGFELPPAIGDVEYTEEDFYD